MSQDWVVKVATFIASFPNCGGPAGAARRLDEETNKLGATEIISVTDSVFSTYDWDNSKYESLKRIVVYRIACDRP